MCYCSLCKTMFNGSGGNLRAHSASHSPTNYTQQQKDIAFILSLVRHYVGLTCLRDPITNILYPGMTCSRATALVELCTNHVKETIIEELDDQSVCLMIDGWSDQSLRRFLGIVVSYFQQDKNRTVYRGLALHWGEGRDHRAINQIEAIKSTLTEYNIMPKKLFLPLRRFSICQHCNCSRDGSDLVSMLRSPVESDRSSFHRQQPVVSQRFTKSYQCSSEEGKMGGVLGGEIWQTKHCRIHTNEMVQCG